MAQQDGKAAAVRFVDLCKDFRSRRGKLTTALDQVNLSVRPQEFLSVVGPSGCGKTTLLRMTAGLEVPSRGHVEINGTKVVQSHPDVGIMFQAPVLLPWRTVIGNVILPSDLTGRSGAKDIARARELLELVGLSDFADHYPRELSGGMQQRAALARALLSDPEVLLLDEPFGALDALTREDLNLELMRVWNQRKKTAILITHSISEAVFLSDRVVIMNTGPGCVREIVDVPLPRPRLPEMRYEPAFGEIAQHITEELTRRPAPVEKAA
jgi:NitT/TauT family transport system ATP-binding protein